MPDRPFFRIPIDGDPDSPWPIFERLTRTHGELAELVDILDDCPVAFMFRASEWEKSGRQILGECHIPKVQGTLAPLFLQLLEDALGYEPTFLIILSADWWEEVVEEEREILVFHEALHAGQARDRNGELRFNNLTGLPIPALRPHDVEEFTAVAARYGAWKSDLREFIEAVDGHRARAAVANDRRVA